MEQQRGPVVLNLSTSRVTEDIAARLGCPVFRAPVGEINVVERMIAENSVLGGEGNGGVIDPRVGYVRDSFVAMALVLDLLAATGLTLSRLVAGLPRYSMVKHKFPLAESAGDSQSQRQAGDNGRRLWQRISGRYPEARADFSDGLRLDWDDRWAHVRASNTEPIMRVISEAPNLQAAEELAREVGSCVAGPKPKSAP